MQDQKSLIARLKAAGIDLPVDFSGRFTRNGAQWLIGKSISRDGKPPLFVVNFGDFSRDLSESFLSEHTPEASLLSAQVSKDAADARLATWEATAKEVELELQGFRSSLDAPYLAKRGLPLAPGLLVEVDPRGNRLIVPARDVHGKAWGYQRIYSEKLSIGTDKIFRKDARKSGCFFILPGEESEHEAVTGEPERLYFCEGVATAITVWLALDKKEAVLACFDAGNLKAVAESIRNDGRTLPEFIFCADNDRFPGEDGRPPSYTGYKKASAAAEAAGNSRVIIAHFTPDQPTGTDFDDLRQMSGLGEVLKQISPGQEYAVEVHGVKADQTCTKIADPLQGVEGEAPATPSGKNVGVKEGALISERGGKGKKSKVPPESLTAKMFLDTFGPDIVVQDRDVFIYRDGYWQHQGPDDVRMLKVRLGQIIGPRGGVRDIENAWKLFIIIAPSLPHGVNLFSPTFNAANFENGTLHRVGQKGLEFRDHSRADYLNSKIPLHFPGLLSNGEPSFAGGNQKFHDFLGRVFSDDPQKRKLMSQIFGAALMPVIPKIFFLVGPPGTGKSTLGKLLYRLLDARNVSHVDPSQFHGFNMETMVGKQLNMDMDINLQRFMNDAIAKKITDGIPFRIARKFQTDVLAPLAPINVFGGNALPRSLDGGSQAYARRVMILRFNGYRIDPFGTDWSHDFADQVWGDGPRGILNFALEGLYSLLQDQAYALPGDSREEVQEWEMESDILGQFLEAMEHGELDKGNQYKVADGAKISFKNLWECFNEWQNEGTGNVTGNYQWSGKRLTMELKKKGFKTYRTKSERGYCGIGVNPAPDAPL